jgi:hypothetical protein
MSTTIDNLNARLCVCSPYTATSLDNRHPRSAQFSHIVKAASSGVADIQALYSVRQDITTVKDFLIQADTTLCARWNDQRPINCLPRELLVYIFEHCCPTAYYLAQGGGTDIDVPDTALAFSQVCKGWRNLAVSTPALWTTPIFDWPSSRDVSKIMAERAGTRPLHITARVVDITTTIAVISVVQHSSPFVHYVELVGARERILDVILAMRERSLPMLKKMSLKVDPEEEEDDADETLHLSVEASPDDAPQLRDLELRGCMLSWDSPLYSSVTNLCISLSNAPSGLRFQDIIRILKHTPLLTKLYLQEVYDRHGDMELLPVEPIERSLHLSCLERLTLADVTSITIPLVRQLNFPRGAFVNVIGLVFWDTRNHDRLTSSGLEHFYRYFGEHHGEGEGWEHLTLKCEPSGFTELDVYTVPHQLDQAKDEGDSETCLLSVGMDLVRGAASPVAGFGDLVRIVTLRLPLSNIVSLSLAQFDREAINPSIRNLLLKLPALRHLQARNAMLPEIIAALDPKSPFGMEIAAPVLETFRLDNALLVDQTNDPLPDDASVMLLNLVNLPELVRLQRHRREAGHEIKRLIFFLCECIVSGEKRTEPKHIRPYLINYMDGATQLKLLPYEAK